MTSSIDEMRRTLDFHFALADRQRRHAGFFAAAFKWTIPILAALVSAFLTGQYEILGFQLSNLALWLSLLLTLLTVISATAKPGEEFRSSCFFASSFRTFRSKLDIDLQRLQNGSGSEQEKLDRQLTYLEQQTTELEQLIATFNGSFAPAGMPASRP